MKKQPTKRSPFYEMDGMAKSVPFYVLNVGEKFKYNGLIYEKIHEDGGKSGEKVQFFWPTATVRLLKPTKRSVLIEKYPALARIYYS